MSARKASMLDSVHCAYRLVVNGGRSMRYAELGLHVKVSMDDSLAVA